MLTKTAVVMYATVHLGQPGILIQHLCKSLTMQS